MSEDSVLQNSWLSALPYLGQWITSVISGIVADVLYQKTKLTVTTVRKIMTTLGRNCIDSNKNIRFNNLTTNDWHYLF